MVNSKNTCGENCIINQIGNELPPPLVVEKKCSNCSNFVALNQHTKCFDCFDDNDFQEYSYYHENCLMEDLALLPNSPPRLSSSRYCHDGVCEPDTDHCQSGCWRYWCNDCDFGLAGMYSTCPNKDCHRYYKIFTSNGLKCLLCDNESFKDECNCVEKIKEKNQ